MFDDIPLWLYAVLAVVAVVTIFLAVRVLVRLYGLRRRVHAPDAPGTARFAYYAAWLYAISPVDFLPDPIYLDDIGVVLAAIATIERLTRRDRENSGPVTIRP
ncbi:hypothetical protein [Actinocorallia longicatena]|uniref:DUF1232 domain-containing protein n=1 Tax=Actinocorallia longicatena TaxID=111803 RepID=A0ABP6QNH8_9ACTN